MKIYRNNTIIAEVFLKDNTYGLDDTSGANLLKVYFDVLDPIEFEINDYVDVDGEIYKIRHSENVKKEAISLGHSYSITFYSSRYDLEDVTFFLNGIPERKKNFAKYTGNAREILNLIVQNMNREDSGWSVGECIETTRETFDFTDMQCSDVVSTVIKQFETEYHVRNKTISFGEKRFPANGLTLGYGEGMGLTEIEILALEEKPPFTVLYPYGSDENLGTDYGSDYLLLPGKQMSIEKNVDKYGRKGRSKQFSHIFPKGEFSVTEKVDDLTLKASGIDFDLAAYTLKDVEAIVTFQDGALAGYDFAIEDKSWNNSKKQFKLKQNTKENALKVPGDINFAVGDKFILTKIKMPQTYIDKASQQLLTEAQAYLNKGCEKRVQLRTRCDNNMFRNSDFYIQSGQMIHIIYDKLKLDREIRCIGVKRYLENDEQPYRYELTLSDFTSTNDFKNFIDEVKRYPDEIKQSEARSKEYAERNYRDVIELQEKMYDPEGDFFQQAIKPLSVQALQLVSAAPSLQFKFLNSSESFFTPTFLYNKTNNTFEAGAGKLVHMTIGLDTIKPASARKLSDYKSWDIQSFTSRTLNPNQWYYLYARCNMSNTSGTYVLSETPIEIDAQTGYYHFWVGFLNSQYNEDRSFRTVFGYTEIVGGNVTTDNIISSNGKTYIKLLENIIRLGDDNTYLDFRNGVLTIKGVVVQSPSGETSYLPSFRGQYDSSKTYYPGDEAVFNGSMYRCIKQNTGGLTILSTEYWIVVAQKGTNGADGQDGQDGKNGTNGKDGINGTNGKDGINGKDGLPGALPTTRQWVSGTTYYRNDDRVDYIMYRANANSTPTWWRVRKGYTSAVAGSTPSSSSAFEQITSYEAIATMVLLANEANIANLIFKDGVLVSQNSTNGVRNIMINGKTGEAWFAAKNLQINSDGSLSIGKGSFYVDRSGAALLKGGFTSNESGRNRVEIPWSSTAVMSMYNRNNVSTFDWSFGSGYTQMNMYKYRDTTLIGAGELSPTSLRLANNPWSGGYVDIDASGKIMVNLSTFPSTSNLSSLEVGTLYRDGNTIKIKT